jgi:hypothetical protein
MAKMVVVAEMVVVVEGGEGLEEEAGVGTGMEVEYKALSSSFVKYKFFS